MATTVARLQAVLSANTRDFDQAMNTSETKMQKAGKVAGLAGLAIAGGLAVGLKKSVDAALESEKAQARLDQAMKSAGVSQVKYGSAIEANIQKTSRLAAIDDEDLSDSFAKLVRTTKDVTAATEGMNLAADIARARNISLEMSTKMVERAYAGNAAAFSRIGIVMPKVSDAYDALKGQVDTLRDSMKDANDDEKAAIQVKIDTIEQSYAAARASDKQSTAMSALGEATKRFTGTAETYGKTSAAAQERFRVALENLQEKIGTAVLPILKDFINQLTRLLTWVEENQKAAKIIIATLGGLAAVLLTVSIATKAATAAIAIKTAAVATWNAAVKIATATQWLFNAALSANPIGLVVLALAGLTAGVIVAYKRSETFREIVDNLWDKLKALGNWIREHWGTISSIITKAPMIVAFRTMADTIDRVIAGVKWLIDNMGRIPSPSLPSLPDLNPFNNNSEVGKTPTSGVTSALWDEIALGKGMGLTMTSGLRVGDDGDHGRGRAIDMSGPASAMATFAMAAMGRPGIKDVIYGGLPFWMDNGRRVGTWAGNESLRGDHYNHAHVSVFDKGGWLKPGLTLAYNGTGAPERVGGGNATFNINLGGENVATVVWDQLRNKAQVFERRNGRSAF